MTFSLCYITNRANPCFQWFADSLCRQVGSGAFPEVIFIDSVLWGGNAKERIAELERIVDGRFSYRHSPPKPTTWQGPSRLTQSDYFAASNARNTGIALCRTPYIVFVDDLSVLLPGWLDNARHAAKDGYIVGGAYKKVFEMVVENGELKCCRETAGGTDSRWHRGSDGGVVDMGSESCLFGCSCGFPIDALLKVNGYDEIYDSMGAEDYSLMITLGKWGYKWFYNRNMRTYESEELHGQGPVMKRVIFPGNPDSSHVILNRLRADPAPRTYGNHFDLTQLRARVLNGEPFPGATKPTHHWFQGKPLAEFL